MFQVNLEYLESKLETVDGEEVQRIQDNINSLFHHCVQALGEEHQIKVVNALQVTKAHFHLQDTLPNCLGLSDSWIQFCVTTVAPRRLESGRRFCVCVEHFTEFTVLATPVLFCLSTQTLCALFRGVHQKNKSASGFDIINMLMGFDKAEQRMKVCGKHLEM